MTRTVTDAALLLTVLAGPDRRDPVALRAGRPRLPDRPRGRRGGAAHRLQPRPWAGRGGAGDCRERRGGRVRTLERLGARVSAISPPGIEAIVPAHRTCYMAIFAQFLEGLTAEQQDLLDPYLRAGAEAGRKITAAAYHAALHDPSGGGRSDGGPVRGPRSPRAAWLPRPGPAGPGPAGRLRGKAPALTCWANHTGQPVASVPCGLTRERLPIGIQIAGPRFADAAGAEGRASLRSRPRPVFPSAPVMTPTIGPLDAGRPHASKQEEQA